MECEVNGVWRVKLSVDLQNGSPPAIASIPNEWPLKAGWDFPSYVVAWPLRKIVDSFYCFVFYCIFLDRDFWEDYLAPLNFGPLWSSRFNFGAPFPDVIFFVKNFFRVFFTSIPKIKGKKRDEVRSVLLSVYFYYKYGMIYERTNLWRL